MKALYVAFDTFPRAKGSSSHIASMVKSLEETFGAVELLCLGTPEMPAWQQEGGIEIRRFRERRRELLARATAFARFVRARMDRLRGELALAVFRDPWSGYPVLEARPGCPAIFEVNALPTWELGYARPALAANPALRAKLGDLERRCLRESARILCVSSVTRDALAGLGIERAKMAVIPNAAHDVFFSARVEDCPVRAMDDGAWIGYIGSLQPWQGVEDMVDAFALVAESEPRSRLLILHGGSARALRPVERQVAKRGLQDRVLLHEPVGPAGVAAVLKRLRCSVVPLAETARNTVQGCCPVKMIESMAAGTPVIASDLAVTREWMRGGSEGLLAAPGDRREWAYQMLRLLKDEGLREELGRGARVRAEECFSRAVIGSRLQQEFLDAAGGARQ